MKKFRIYFNVDFPYGQIDIDADTEEEAIGIFERMSWDMIEEKSGCYPDDQDIEVDYIFKLEGEE